MNENHQESEPLLDDAEYELLRADSLLARVDSNNFASLLENGTPPTVDNELNQHQGQPSVQYQLHPHLQSQPPQQQQPLQQPQPQQEVPSEIQLLINNHLSMDNGMLLPSNDLAVDVSQWGHLDVLTEGPVDGCDSNQPASLLPDTTPNSQVPSLQVWPGMYDFNISLPTGNKDRNKWCFSECQNKLYLCPFIAVPIHVKLLQWIDASITITPVFKESRHRVDAVLPCFNCKSKVTNDIADHLVMVEGQECVYKQINERHVVSVPLLPPPPGEASSTLLVKLSCLQSCIGGPNRRPFCLVFTLHNISGNVVGRQVLDLKCCRCPSRDMLNEEKAEERRRRPSVTPQPNTALLRPLDHVMVQTAKRSAPAVATTGEKKQRLDIKMEPGTEDNYKSLAVPTKYVRKVKTYINSLIAKDFIHRKQPNLFLYSEDEEL